MKAQNFILLLILLVSLASCKKKHNVTIQAQDVVSGDGSAYANMPFTVVESRTGAFEDKHKTAYEGVLDANGYASFDLKMNKDWNYILNVEQPDNICYGGALAHYLDNESNNVVNIDYLKCGYLDIKSNNLNCEDSSDEFRFRFYFSNNPDIYTYKGFGTLNEWHNQAIYGCMDYSNAEPFYRDVPEGEYTVEWEVIRQSGTTTGTNVFTITENDTITYIIEY